MAGSAGITPVVVLKRDPWHRHMIVASARLKSAIPPWAGMSFILPDGMNNQAPLQTGPGLSEPVTAWLCESASSFKGGSVVLAIIEAAARCCLILGGGMAAPGWAGRLRYRVLGPRGLTCG